ncbi:hypothetical protein BH11PLA2_BH11PLA2_27990 [soil metagenome]
MRVVFSLVLILTTVAAGQSPSNSMEPNTRQKALDRLRRVIVNNDGSEPVIEMKTPTEKEFLDLRTTALADTQVDSIFYCSRTSGFGVFTHFTKIGQVFTCTEGRYSGNQMAALLKAGLDPLKMQCDFGKKHNIEVFWSMRMNDTHDGSKTEYGPTLIKDSKLKNEHPEYLIGTSNKRPKIGAWTAVDYALPEIRDLAFRYIDEVCRNYDINGIELDFFRHPVYFKSTSRGEPATAAEIGGMTDLITRIRTMVDEVGKARGKPILIAVKMPDSLEYCKTMGLDLEAWLKAGLLDLYIPGGILQFNDWPYSVALARKYGVKVYPSLDNVSLKDKTAEERRMAVIAYRGRAATAWAAGADGIYYYNFPKTHNDLLKETGDPKRLAKLDRDYYAFPRGNARSSAGNYPIETFQKLETLGPAIPKLLTPGKAVMSRLVVGEAFGKRADIVLKLRVQVQSGPSAGQLRAKWNDAPLELFAAGEDWYESAVASETILADDNRFELTNLAEAHKKALWCYLVLQLRNK